MTIARRATSSVLLALTLVATATASASASGSWSREGKLAADGGNVHVIADASGTTTAVWTRRKLDTGKREVLSASRPAGGAFGPTRLVSFDRYDQYIGLGQDAAGTTTAVFYDGGGVLRAASAAAGSPFGAPVTLTDEAGQNPPSLAVDAAGGAIVVWDGPTMALRPPGGAFGAPQPVEPEDEDGLHASGDFPSVAMNARGDAVVAWTNDAGDVRATVRAAGGAFQPPVKVASAGSWDEKPGELATAVDPHGAAIVAWTTGSPTEGDSTGNAHVVVAVRPTGGTFGAPQPLSAAGGSDPQVGVDAAGNATVAWTLAQRGGEPRYRDRIQVAVRPAGGAFAPARDVSRVADGGDTIDALSLDVAPDGTAALAWPLHYTEGSETDDDSIVTALRAAGGDFETPTILNDRCTGSHIEPSVALDPAGNALVAWTNLTGTVDPLGTGTTIPLGIWTATRPAGSAPGSAGANLCKKAPTGPSAHVSVSHRRLGVMLRRGLLVSVRSSSPATVWVAVTALSPSNLGGGQTTKRLRQAGTARVTVHFGAAARRALAHVRRATFEINVVVGATSVTKKVTVRR